MATVSKLLRTLVLLILLGRTLVAQSPPSPPNLLSPLNGAFGVSAYPASLTWQGGPYSYRLQVSTSADFVSIVFDRGNILQNYTEATYGVQLLDSTLYYWRVSASNANGTSDWSSVWSFTTTIENPTISRPAPPTLVYPPNNASGLHPILGGITFRWNRSPGAIVYEVMYSRDPNFTYYVQTGGATNVSDTVSGPYADEGGTWYWRVRATNTAGTGDWSTVWSYKVLPRSPILVFPLNGASGIGTDPTLLWQASNGATSYRVRVATDFNLSSLIVDADNITGTSYSLSNLTHNTTFYWRVDAKDEHGTGDFIYGGPWNFKTVAGPPEAPTLSSPSNGATGVSTSPTLSWRASGGFSYRLQISTSPNFSPLLVDQDNITGTSQQVVDLAGNTRYYWHVSAANDSGTSSYSSAWSFTTTVSPPSIPTLSFPSNGATDVPIEPTLSWLPSIGATSYRLQWSTNSTFMTSSVQSNITGTSQQIFSLANNTVYFWRVSALNAGGTSFYSSTWSFTTVVAPPPTPTVPTLVSPSNGAAGISLNPTLTWTASLGATRYFLQVATDLSFSTIMVNKDLSGTSYGLNDLVNNITYYWRVAAIGSSGIVTYSTPWSFTTVGVTPPGAPTLALPSNGATGVSTGPTLSWNASGGATSFQLQVSTSSGFSTTVFDQGNIGITSQQITGLANNTLYYWRVSATNAGGTSTFSTPWSFTTIAMAPPASPALISPGNGATGVAMPPTLRWHASPGATSYRLMVSIDSSFSVYNADLSNLTDTLQQLPFNVNNVLYYWRVNATNAGGTSTWSSVWSFTTIVAVPSAPTLSSPSNGATGVPTSPILSWNASSGTMSYQLQVSTSVSFSTIAYDRSNVTGTSHQVSSLASNTVYYWRVRATNFGGTSTFSSTWSFTTLPAAPVTPTLSTPANGAVGVSTSPVLSWTSSTGASSYHLQVSTDGLFTLRIVDDSSLTSTSRSVGPLTSGTAYYWRVRGMNIGGASSFSSTWSFTTAVAAPAAPSLVSPPDGATRLSGNVKLVWRASTRATQYRLELSLDSSFSGFTGGISADAVDTSYYFDRLVDNSNYFWRVRPLNQAGWGEYSTIWRFATIASPPGSPGLASPSNGATGVSTSPTLSWYSSNGATSYRLEVSTNSSFSPLVYEQSGITGTSQQVPSLADNMLYFWRVNAANTGGTSSYSSTWSFTTIVAVPSTPVLLTPANGSINQQLNAILTWNLAIRAENYRLQLSSNPNLSPTVVDDSTLTTTSCFVGPLALNTLYFWRVSAKNLGGVSPWSNIFSFSTIRTTLVETIGNDVPKEHTLGQNYPNPFNPATTVHFALSRRSYVSLRVFDALGKEVATLVTQELGPGYFAAKWNADVPSGIYFYRLQAGEFVETKKMILLR